MFDALVNSLNSRCSGRLRKKLQRQSARLLRSETHFSVRRNDEGGSATQHMDFLRSRHILPVSANPEGHQPQDKPKRSPGNLERQCPAHLLPDAGERCIGGSARKVHRQKGGYGRHDQKPGDSWQPGRKINHRQQKQGEGAADGEPLQGKGAAREKGEEKRRQDRA